MSEDEAEEEQQGESDLEPQTRAAFQLLREQFSNTALFAASLLSDRLLQKRVRLLRHVLSPLHMEYAEDLRRHTNGQVSTLYWHGDRACGAWYKGAVADTLDLLNDSRIINVLDLHPPPLSVEFCKCPDDPCLKDDSTLLSQFLLFITELSANRCWSQAFWSLSVPYAFAGLYASSQEDRQWMQGQLRKLANAALALEAHLATVQKKAGDLQRLYKDLGTMSWQLTRELLVSGLAADWSPADPVLRQLCHAMYAGPGSTKDGLESAFNYLKDSLSPTKHKTFSPWTRFFYLLANPSCDSTGVSLVRPAPEDFSRLLQHGFRDTEVTSLGPFKPRKTGLGPEFPRPDQIIGEWRKAGFFSNRSSAAAFAALLDQHENGFQNVSKLWTGGVDGGCLQGLLPLKVFNTGSNKLLLLN